MFIRILNLIINLYRYLRTQRELGYVAFAEKNTFYCIDAYF